MEQTLENSKTGVQGRYEAPRMTVIEMEIEGPILQMSGEDSGQEDW